jgi:osmotically-inducible protein OsmY
MIASSTLPEIVSMPSSVRGTDDHLQDAIVQGLRGSGYRALSDVQCEVLGGVVALSGTVPSFFVKQIAQTIILRMGSVKRLKNHLEVQNAYYDSGYSESHQDFEKMAS